MAAGRVSHYKGHLNVSPTSAGPVDVDALADWLCHDNRAVRKRIYEFLRDPIYRPQHHLSLEEFRELTLQRLIKYVNEGFFSINDYLDNPRRFMMGLECLGLCDYSLCIKAGVHFTLCGGTIAKLGTEKHHREWLPKIDSLELPGCFAMTEVSTGSNVMGIETTATLDPATKEFVINTPGDTASKYWIGGAAQHGKVCTVFAQLTVNGKYEGPHVFIVRLRDDAGRLMPGVRIEDCGAKMGLNGVDNGRIWFDHVRVPLDNLLNRYANVDAAGNYTSPVPTVAERFGITVGGLTTGRVLIAQAAVCACQQAVTIATNYSCHRPQFGKMIMEYLTQQRRLLPALATTYAYTMAMKAFKVKFAARPPSSPKLIHVQSSGLKAGATWERVRILQDCRECCGGMGFLAANKIGCMKTDMDVDTTFEGDNTVLMQQVAKPLVDAALKALQKGQLPRLAAPRLSGGQPFAPDAILGAMEFREKALTAGLAKAMGKAAQGVLMSGGNRKAVMAAITGVFDAQLDVVLELGWAYVDALVLASFLEAIRAAPPAWQPTLRQLAALYGLSKVEKHAAFFVAEGVLDKAGLASVREQVNAICAALTADGGKLALQLCSAFDMPEHLLAAPIAGDWTQNISEAHPFGH